MFSPLYFSSVSDARKKNGRVSLDENHFIKIQDADAWAEISAICGKSKWRSLMVEDTPFKYTSLSFRKLIDFYIPCCLLEEDFRYKRQNGSAYFIIKF
jgi:hypothetical protein